MRGMPSQEGTKTRKVLVSVDISPECVVLLGSICVNFKNGHVCIHEMTLDHVWPASMNMK